MESTGSMVAEVSTSVPPSMVPVNLITSPVPVLLKLNELIINGDLPSNPEPPIWALPPREKVYDKQRRTKEDRDKLAVAQLNKYLNESIDEFDEITLKINLCQRYSGPIDCG